jgi:PTH1 family peptidyl-tRNA hydrolase
VKLVVGLGNPGPRYASTRHNVGFRIVERFAANHRIELAPKRYGGSCGRGLVAGPDGAATDVAVLRPEAFMNRSGTVVANALRYLPLDDPGEDVIVAFDDVDLPFGRMRIRPTGSSAGHRGLEDIIECLGTDRFVRLRFGIDRPRDGSETSQYVLHAFSAEEEGDLGARVAKAAEALAAIIAEGVGPAMNRFNRQGSSDR